MTESTETKIRAALAQLDPKDDKHWTSDGAPRMDAVERLVGANVSRGDVRSAAPRFSRENPVLEDAPVSDPAPVEEDDPVLAEGPVEEDELEPAEDHRLDEPMDELEKALLEAQAEHDEAVRAAAAAKARVDQARSKVDEVIATREAGVSPNANMESIQQYLQRQKELREARGMARRVLAEGGISEEILRQLTGHAPIDQAMARKRARGTERPNRAVNPPGWE